LVPLARTDARWIRAFFFGLLAEFATIVTIILIVTAHSVAKGGPMMDTTSRFATIWGATIGIVGGAFYVYLFARWIGSLVSRNFIAHGIVVAVTAAAFHLLTALGSAEQLGALQYGADALKIAAGVLGGWVASRNV
jgi:predicted membrane channel-forming protein YqfA (hemolysin III family)